VTGLIWSSAKGTISNTADVNVIGNFTDTNTSNNQAVDNTTIVQTVDLIINKTDGLTSAVPSSLITYTISVQNQGPSDADNVTVTDVFPFDILANVSWTCSAIGNAICSPANSGIVNMTETVILPAGGCVTYEVTALIFASSRGTIFNSASLTLLGQVNDSNVQNNDAQDNTTITPQTNLLINKTDNSNTIIAGTSVTYTITVTNEGPSDAQDNTTITPQTNLLINKTDNSNTIIAGTSVTYTITVTNEGPSDALLNEVNITDIIPSILYNTNWTCSSVAPVSSCSPVGNNSIFDSLASLTVGSTIQYFVTADIYSSATGNLINTATVSTRNGLVDVVSTDDESTDIDIILLQSDLSVNKDDAILIATPGMNTTYTITVVNNGPSDNLAVTVQDIFSLQLQSVSWSCSITFGTNTSSCGTGSSLILNETISLLDGASATYIVTVEIETSARGFLINTVDASSNVNDTNTSNNVSEDSDYLQPLVDLSITKTDGLSEISAGEILTYTITLTNNGPSSILVSDNAMQVIDIFDSRFASVNFSCGVVSGTGNCTSTGSNNLTDLNAELEVGTVLQYTVTGLVWSSAKGYIMNTVDVNIIGNFTDTNTTNNEATDNTTLVQTVDLVINKTDGLTSVVPSSYITYTITVENQGPSDADNVTVLDFFPYDLLANVSWTCSSIGNATCSSSSSGQVNMTETVILPAGGCVSYEITAFVYASSRGTIINSVSLTLLSQVNDTNIQNNEAQDNTTITAQTNLIINKTDNSNTVIAGTNVTYTITVTNEGPSDALSTEVNITDIVSPILFDVFWTCSFSLVNPTSFCTSNGTGSVSDLAARLEVGSTIQYILTANIYSSSTGNLINTATVTTINGLVDTGSSDDVSTDIDLITLESDLSITKDDATLTSIPGLNTTYTITVVNNGPSDNLAVTVLDTFSTQIETISWSCSLTFGTNTTTCGSGSSNLNETISLLEGATAVYIVTAELYSSSRGQLINQAQVTSNVNDSLTTNNLSEDNDFLQPLVDISITKTDGISEINAGEVLTYTITVSNAGPSSILVTDGSMQVVDIFDNRFASVNFTCVLISGAGNCTSTGSNNLTDLNAELEVGAMIEYTVTGLIWSSAKGTISNTVDVNVIGNFTDTNTSNNHPEPTHNTALPRCFCRSALFRGCVVGGGWSLRRAAGVLCGHGGPVQRGAGDEALRPFFPDRWLFLARWRRK